MDFDFSIESSTEHSARFGLKVENYIITPVFSEDDNIGDQFGAGRAIRTEPETGEVDLLDLLSYLTSFFDLVSEAIRSRFNERDFIRFVVANFFYLFL